MKTPPDGVTGILVTPAGPGETVETYQAMIPVVDGGPEFLKVEISRP